MNSLWSLDTLFYLLLNAFRVYVMYRFIHVFFEKRKTSGIVEFLCFAGYYAINSMAYLLYENAILNIFSNIIPFFLITLLFNSKLSTKILATIIVYPLQMVAEMIAYFPLSTITEGGTLVTVTGIISNLLMFIFSLIAGRMVNKNGRAELYSGRWVALLSIPICSIFVSAVLFLQGNGSVWISLAACFLLAINFMTFFLYESMIRHYMEEQERQLLIQQNHAYLQQFDLIKNNDQRFRIIRHDLKNQLYSIRMLIRDGKDEEVIKYLDSMEHFAIGEGQHVNTGNTNIDSILNYKISEAIGQGIAVNTEILVPDSIPLDPFVLNVVIGNLFDNAIEAASQSDNKEIKFNMRADNSTLVIKIENYFAGKLNQKNGQYATTKSDKIHHGLGLKSIQMILDKNNGNIDIEVKDQKFTAVILLYFL